MSLKDSVLALCVVIVWGVNFVVIDIGLQHMPPFMLAGLRFLLVALPAVFFVKPPKIPLYWLIAYAMTMSFGQFAFLFLAIKWGMPAGLASLVIQSQAFFTLLLGALLLAEKLKWYHIIGIIIATAGIFLLLPTGTPSSGGEVSVTTLLLTLTAALSWGLGNISNKIIMRHYPQLSVMSLVIWSALIPIMPFFLCAWLFYGSASIISQLVHIHLSTILSLLYLAFIASIFGYSVWGLLLSRYETWRVAPLTLLVPVVAIVSAILFLHERFNKQQMAGVVIVVIGLLFNMFGSQLQQRLRRQQCVSKPTQK